MTECNLWVGFNVHINTSWVISETSLSSQSLNDLVTCVTRRTSNTFGDRCFAAAGPRLWNSLPINLRQCRSLEQFERVLKTFLFSAWGHGALWYFTKSAPHINPLTYLLIYLIKSLQKSTLMSALVLDDRLMRRGTTSSDQPPPLPWQWMPPRSRVMEAASLRQSVQTFTIVNL